MIELAQIGADGHANLEGLAALPDPEALARLSQLRGVGRWTAEYVLLRTLGRLNVFPGDDVGASNNLQRWLGLEQHLDYAAVGRVLARWQTLSRAGLFSSVAGTAHRSWTLADEYPTGGMTT